ncbi:MAG: transcriptional repressor [Acidobacteria bacterium]|nr:transcriptional repressor [Acidobacteriota bacterium]
MKQRLEQFREGLRRAGVKLTPQRTEIFRVVAASGDHPDAETVLGGVRKRLPSVSLDTVYRTLWLLVDLGLLSTLGTPRERTRFDANRGPHHHFVCRACGATHDFACEALDRLDLPDAVRAMGSVETARVEVRGLCRRCAAREAKDPAKGSAPALPADHRDE